MNSVCEHGQLKRKCDSCDVIALEGEIQSLTQELAEARAVISFYGSQKYLEIKEYTHSGCGYVEVGTRAEDADKGKRARDFLKKYPEGQGNRREG